MAHAIPPEWLEEQITAEEAKHRHPGAKDERVVRRPKLGKCGAPRN